MTYIDLVGLISAALILLAIGGVLADRAVAESRADSRRQAHRVK